MAVGRRRRRLQLLLLELRRVLHHALYRRLNVGLQPAHQRRKARRVGVLDAMQRLCKEGGREGGKGAVSLRDGPTPAQRFRPPLCRRRRYGPGRPGFPAVPPPSARLRLRLRRGAGGLGLWLACEVDEGVYGVDGGGHLLHLVLAVVLVICREGGGGRRGGDGVEWEARERERGRKGGERGWSVGLERWPGRCPAPANPLHRAGTGGMPARAPSSSSSSSSSSAPARLAAMRCSRLQQRGHIGPPQARVRQAAGAFAGRPAPAAPHAWLAQPQYSCISAWYYRFNFGTSVTAVQRYHPLT